MRARLSCSASSGFFCLAAVVVANDGGSGDHAGMSESTTSHLRCVTKILLPATAHHQSRTMAVRVRSVGTRVRVGDRGKRRCQSCCWQRDSRLAQTGDLRLHNAVSLRARGTREHGGVLGVVITVLNSVCVLTVCRERAVFSVCITMVHTSGFFLWSPIAIAMVSRSSMGGS